MEILGENLQPLFKNEKLKGKRTYCGNKYEVWEISSETYEILCDMLNSENDKYPNSAWYYADGSNMGAPNAEYIIHKQPIKAWDGEARLNWKDDECVECSDYLNGRCFAIDDDVLSCLGQRECYNLTDYFSYEIHVGLLKNICALAVDLAKYNNMTLGELFTKYEGSDDNK